MKLALMLSAVAFVSGCYSFPPSGGGEKFSEPAEPDENKALVYIYRNAFRLGGGGATVVYFGAEEKARLDNRGYSTIEVAAGCYQINQKWPDQGATGVIAIPFEICVENHKRYFLKIQPEKGTSKAITIGYTFIGVGSAYSRIVPVSEEFALREKEILNCYLYPG